MIRRRRTGERWRLETDESGLVTRLRNYFYTPHFLEAVCRELGVPFRINGYRYW